MIIAVDGVSASGKGTLSKMLAQKLNYAYLDTGLLYRATAYKAYKEKVLEVPSKVAIIAFSLGEGDIDIPFLKGDDIAQLASKVAVYKEVRESLLKLQRDFGNNKGFTKDKGKYQGAILDGRDIGTVIFPNANIKFYITADSFIRAQRRYKQLQELNVKESNLTIKEIQISLEERDLQDMNRKEGGLRKSEDAYEIDTSHVSIEESFNHMYNLVKNILQI